MQTRKWLAALRWLALAAMVVAVLVGAVVSYLVLD
jgi:hypothetical protein